MSSLASRVAKVEESRGKRSFTVRDAIDRPPQETREQWMARRAGNPDPHLVNCRGENFGQWVSRRQAELQQEVSHAITQ